MLPCGIFNIPCGTLCYLAVHCATLRYIVVFSTTPYDCIPNYKPDLKIKKSEKKMLVSEKNSGSDEELSVGLV